MVGPATMQDMCIPIPRDTMSRQLYIAAVLAKMSYIHREPELMKAMGAFLGCDDFQWIQTPGDVTVNFLVGTGPGGVIVVFSGTENPWQIVFYGLLTINHISQADFIGRVHLGFHQIWARTFDLLLSAIPSSKRGFPITFIGHSLGGAIALLWAEYARVNFLFKVNNVITFGCPAVGDRILTGLMSDLPRTMVRHERDIVPFLPPQTGLGPRFGLSIPFMMIFQEWIRLDPQIVLYLDDSYELRKFPLNQWDWRRFGAAVNWFLLPTDTAFVNDPDIWLNMHAIDTYMEWIKRSLKRSGLYTDLEAIDEINKQIDILQRPGEDVTEIPPGSLDSLIRSISPTLPNVQPNPLPPLFVGPEQIQAGNAATIDGPSISRETQFNFQVVPFATRQGTVNDAGAPAIDAVMYGEPQRPWWLIRGQERRTLQKLGKVLDAMLVRDNKVQAKKMTGDVTPGVQIIDPSEENLADSYNAIKDQINLILSLQQNDVG